MGKFGNTRIDLSSFSYPLEDISDKLSQLLDTYRMEVSGYGAYTDSETGYTYIKLVDNQNDSVEIFINKDLDGTPGCSILDDADEEKGWIDLDGVLPVSQGVLKIGSLEWLRKTVLMSIMKHSSVDFRPKVVEHSQAGRIEYQIGEAFATRGDRLVSVVTNRKRSRKFDDRSLIILGAARRLFHYLQFQKLSVGDQISDKANPAGLDSGV